MLDVVQKTISGSEHVKFEFSEPGAAFLVKNFSTAEIKVRVGDTSGEVIIPAGCYQLVIVNFEYAFPKTLEKSDFIMVTGDGTGSGTVEAQRIDRAGVPI